MVDAVLLEWEGVLADTRADRQRALSLALAAEGLQVDASECAHLCDGRPVRQAASAALAVVHRDDATLAELVALRATRLFAEQLGKGVTLLAGAREFIEHAQVQSRVAIVTTATRSETEFILRLAGLDGAVSTIMSVDDATSDDMNAVERAIDALARRREVRRDHVITIAPSATAVSAGRVARIRTVAFGTPAHVSIEADGTIDSLEGVTLADLAQLAGIAMPERQR